MCAVCQSMLTLSCAICKASPRQAGLRSAPKPVCPTQVSIDRLKNADIPVSREHHIQEDGALKLMDSVNHQVIAVDLVLHFKLTLFRQIIFLKF